MTRSVNLDRDMFNLPLAFVNSSWSDAAAAPTAAAFRVRSDAVIYAKYAAVYSSAPGILSFAGGQHRAIGCHLVGPDASGGSAYSVKLSVSCISDTSPIDQLLISLHAGIPAATLTTASAGDLTQRAVPLACSSGVFGGVLTFDDVIYLQPYDILVPGGGFSSLPVVFFVCLQWRNGTSITDLRALLSLSVQRLSVAPDHYNRLIP